MGQPAKNDSVTVSKQGTVYSCVRYILWRREGQCDLLPSDLFIWIFLAPAGLSTPDCVSVCINNTVSIIPAALLAVKLQWCQTGPSWAPSSNKHTERQALDFYSHFIYLLWESCFFFVDSEEKVYLEETQKKIEAGCIYSFLSNDESIKEAEERMGYETAQRERWKVLKDKKEERNNEWKMFKGKRRKEGRKYRKKDVKNVGAKLNAWGENTGR